MKELYGNTFNKPAVKYYYAVFESWIFTPKGFEGFVKKEKTFGNFKSNSSEVDNPEKTP
jgi:hypothetical protein